MTKVVVVEDSPVVRALLVQVLGEAGIEIIGTAANGEEALQVVRERRPNVITMDIHMPRMDGIEATRRIMETVPTPVVIVSGSTDPGEVATTFRAIEAGAVAVLRRPAGFGHPDHEATVRELVQTVRLMSEIKVIRRWPRAAGGVAVARGVKPVPAFQTSEFRVVALGASTGGPPVLQMILSELRPDFPLPILIVQHMASGFSEGFVRWLAQSSSLPVHLAAHGERIVPGHVYVAPAERRMTIDRRGTIALSEHAAAPGVHDSISRMFRSIADVYGGDAIAGLLTGMGRDGATELKTLRERGATTFAQDEESSVVHGMAGEAIALNAAALVLGIQEIAPTLTKLTSGIAARIR